jgi:hypothetical protein
MFQDRISRGNPLRWVAGVFERSTDLLALGGGMIGLALIVAVIIVGLHERQTSLRSTTPAQHSDTLR